MAVSEKLKFAIKVFSNPLWDKSLFVSRRTKWFSINNKYNYLFHLVHVEINMLKILKLLILETVNKTKINLNKFSKFIKQSLKFKVFFTVGWQGELLNWIKQKVNFNSFLPFFLIILIFLSTKRCWRFSFPLLLIKSFES